MNDQSFDFYPTTDQDGQEIGMWLPVYDGLADVIRGRSFWDIHVFRKLQPYINSDSVVLDLGACFGQMTMAFSKMCAEVHAFEAHPFQYGLIVKTLESNETKNVICYNKAVWDSDNLSLIYPKPKLNVYSSVGSWGIDPTQTELQDEQDVVVQSMTIDSLNLPRVDVVKIDVQGADLRAMRGMVDTIKRCKPVIAFEYETAFAESLFNENIQDYKDFIKEINYHVTWEHEHNYIIEGHS